MADDDYNLVPVDYQPTFADQPIAKAGQTIQQPDIRGDLAAMPGKAANVAGEVTGINDVLRAPTPPEAIGAGIMAGMGLMAPEARVAEEAAPALARGIRAFHGSPYDFDRFDLSQIGTGEGAQAYGHGLYFAENPAVSETYKYAGQPAYQSATVRRIIQDAYDAAQGDDKIAATRNIIWDKYKAETDPFVKSKFQDAYNNVADIVGASAKPQGRLYEVNINANPEHFLDWDKPLSEQSGHVADVLKKMGHGAGKLSDIGKPEEITQKLREAGIPGIKYLDQGSRGAADVPAKVQQTPEGTWIAYTRHGGKIGEFQTQEAAQKAGGPTSNYVVFDDKLIDIVKKYGLAGLIAGGGAHYALQPVDYNPFGTEGFAHGGAVKDAKVSKASVNYRAGGLNNKCSECTMFREPNACSHVTGYISPEGTCDDFEKR